MPDNHPCDLVSQCLLLTVPFRSMLLTWRGGPPCLAPTAHLAPVCQRSFDILTLRFTAHRVRWVPLYCFPTLSLRAFAMYAAFPHADYYALFDCLQGLGAFGAGLPCLLP